MKTFRIMSKVLSVVLGLYLVSMGCSDDGAPSDSAVADLGKPDGPQVVPDGPVTPTEAGSDTTPVDLAPDGPKKPAHWKTITGAPERENHTVTLLKDGRVLVVGGYSYDTNNKKIPKATSIIYDPKNDSFTPAGDMVTPRSNHTATLLDDGRVLVTGGRTHPGYIEKTEFFDPTKPAAQAWSAGKDMYDSRWNHAAVKLKDGRVLVSGGFGSYMPRASIGIFDPKQDLWIAPGQIMNEERELHTMTLLTNGKVLIAGGVKGQQYKETWLQTLEIFDPQNGKMSPVTAQMSERRCAHTATLLPNGTVLIVGGYCGKDCTMKSTDDIYDPQTDSVAPVAHPGSLPTSHFSVLLNDGRVAVIGSEYDKQKAVAFSPGGGGFWVKLPDIPNPHVRAEGVLLNDGSVIGIGGISETGSNYIYSDKAHRLFP